MHDVGTDGGVVTVDVVIDIAGVFGCVVVDGYV